MSAPVVIRRADPKVVTELQRYCNRHRGNGRGKQSEFPSLLLEPGECFDVPVDKRHKAMKHVHNLNQNHKPKRFHYFDGAIYRLR